MAAAIMNERVRSCAEAFAECELACQACARHCVDSGMVEMAECVKRCLDCATLCAACLPLLAHDSSYYAELCRLCAEAATLRLRVREVRRRRHASLRPGLSPRRRRASHARRLIDSKIGSGLRRPPAVPWSLSPPTKATVDSGDSGPSVVRQRTDHGFASHDVV